MTEKHQSTLQQNVGNTFAHFKILSELGRGGMGCVYKAFDTKLERIVALKVLISQAQTNTKQVQRFLIEARATAKLIHPNIVRVYEIGNEKGVVFFTMDYIAGVSLKEVIKSKKLTLHKGLTLMKKVSEAMFYAHQNGIVHRDLKPANIMVDEKGEPRVMDFGLVKMLDSDKKLTKTGTIMGTLFYMPPEQAEGKHREIDQRSDIYSLGAIIYEIITGKVPHYANATLTLLKKITQEPIEAPSTLVKTSQTKDLDYVCLKALAKKKENRYKNANELAQDLECLVERKSITKTTEWRWKRAYTVIIVSIMALIGALYAMSNTKTNSMVVKKTVSNKNKISKKTGKEIVGFIYLREETYSAGGQTHTVKEYRHEKTGMEFVLIPGGSFMMGSNQHPDEMPVRQVTLNSFLMSKTEVTQGVWKKIIGTSPWSGEQYVKEGDNYPATHISWNDCNSFCQKVGAKLPTEAQWEYGCRSGTKSKYYWGNTINNDYLWHRGNTHRVGEKYAHQVKRKKPNAFGLYDMSGNVWEWCSDRYRKYPSKNLANPPPKGFTRVNRGQSWFGLASSLRSAYRSAAPPSQNGSYMGFRLSAVAKLSTK